MLTLNLNQKHFTK